MLQNVASGFTPVGSWRKQQFHVPLPKDASAHVNDSIMTLTYIDYENRPASQPSGNNFHNDMFYTILLHCLTLFCIVYSFSCVSHFFLEKKIPQKSNFPRHKGSDCYFSQKPSTNRTIGVTPFPSLGATGARRRGMTQDVVGLAGFQLDSALCTVWSTAE